MLYFAHKKNSLVLLLIKKKNRDRIWQDGNNARGFFYSIECMPFFIIFFTIKFFIFNFDLFILNICLFNYKLYFIYISIIELEKWERLAKKRWRIEWMGRFHEKIIIMVSLYFSWWEKYYPNIFELLYYWKKILLRKIFFILILCFFKLFCSFLNW